MKPEEICRFRPDAEKAARAGERPEADPVRPGTEEVFRDHDRFRMPEPVRRVTAGPGGESYLILGREKTALYDCGMAYCGDALAERIAGILAREPLAGGNPRTLDYILLSHTHYDHVGGLPYVLKKWENPVVCAAAHGVKVFASPGARRKMKELGEIAWMKNAAETFPPEGADTAGLRIDRVLKEGDRLDLGGGEEVSVWETKGHTDCSLSYLLMPSGLFFSSESTGVLFPPHRMQTPILKDYRDCIASAEKCAGLPVRQIVSPHYGLVPEAYTQAYWEAFLRAAEEKRRFLEPFILEGADPDRILEAYAGEFWHCSESSQPREAFMENAANIIRAVAREILPGETTRKI